MKRKNKAVCKELVINNCQEAEINKVKITWLRPNANINIR